MLKLWKQRHPLIEFSCPEEDWGVIPEPFPSFRHLPEWYKKLPTKLGKGFSQSTIKRCKPVQDALRIGFIIPLAADVRFQTNSDGSGVTPNTRYPKNIVEFHPRAQISAPDAKHPSDPLHPIKFLNFWQIKMPPGYSLLFMPPMHRPDARFECMPGIVDMPFDEFINFPGFIKMKSWDGIIKAGTPLVQVIPFKKDDLLEMTARSMTAADQKRYDKWRRGQAAHESQYFDHKHRPI